MSDDRPDQRKIREAGTGTASPAGTSALLDTAVVTAEESFADVDSTGLPPVGSNWRLIVRRFLRHKVAAASLVVLLLVEPRGGVRVGRVAVRVQPDVDARGAPGGARAAVVGPPLRHRQARPRPATRVLYSLQKSLQIGIGVALLSVVIGVIVGSLAGFYGGLTDGALMRFTDLFLVIPELAVLLIVAKNPDPSFFGIFDLPPATEVSGMVLILAALGWMAVARIVRGEILSLREKEYVEAARAAGASGPRIMLRHLLPNTIGPIVVFATLEVGLAILAEATLSFLGAGIQLPEVSLGNLISDAESTVGTDLAYLIIFPGLTLFLIVLVRELRR